jgi:hypothetical protein
MKMASSVVTIKIEKAKLQLLEELREETNAKNFDEVIRKLTKKPQSMFGAHPEMSSFTEKDKIRFHTLFLF